MCAHAFVRRCAVTHSIRLYATHSLHFERQSICFSWRSRASAFTFCAYVSCLFRFSHRFSHRFSRFKNRRNNIVLISSPNGTTFFTCTYTQNSKEFYLVDNPQTFRRQQSAKDTLHVQYELCCILFLTFSLASFHISTVLGNESKIAAMLVRYALQTTTTIMQQIIYLI